MIFIQNETTHEWVGNFVQFYRQQILSFPKKTLVFDEEKQVMSQITEEDIIIDGKLNPIFFMSNENMMMNYGVSLKDMVNIYTKNKKAK